MAMLVAIGALTVAIIIALGVAKTLELIRNRANNSEGEKN